MTVDGTVRMTTKSRVIDITSERRVAQSTTRRPVSRGRRAVASADTIVLRHGIRCEISLDGATLSRWTTASTVDGRWPNSR